MKTLFKTILVGLLSVLCLTASTTPGFDENGNDINECLKMGACPEGYICLNTPGSYFCEGEGISFETTSEGTPSSGLFYFVTGSCIGLDGLCQAKCTSCQRVYSALLGKAKNVSGVCICGKKTFQEL